MYSLHAESFEAIADFSNSLILVKAENKNAAKLWGSVTGLLDWSGGQSLLFKLVDDAWFKEKKGGAPSKSEKDESSYKPIQKFALGRTSVFSRLLRPWYVAQEEDPIALRNQEV